MADTPTPADAIADELYSQPPADFVARRDAAAKELSAAGDRASAAAVKALKRPSQAGWALNLLARQARDDLEQLVGVGAALRSAQEQLSGPQLRELSQQRQAVVRALAGRARELAKDAGAPLAEPVAEQVRRSLDAALTDAGLAEQLLAGRNVGALEYAAGGFGGRPLSVVPSTSTSPADSKAESKAESKPESKAEEKARTQAEAAARRAAQKAVDDARKASTAATTVREKAEKALEAANLAVAAAQRALDAAVADEDEAEAGLEQARQAETDAALALEDAEAELDD